ncbi:AT-rich interactive domain-containing protein 2 [Cardamine amara subsp. amara]|uniref:AT-rich interactive domain-containing protein 2 n=1 Tax=Cardamine amara subsp. amara TaxID=228776 RepID=A0ABD0ZHP8_CARAN
MAGWSSLNRCSSSFIDIEVKSIDECEERIRRLFDKALLVFLEEEASSSYGRLPVILGDGKKVDLFELFVLVREREGFDSVSKKGLWGLVAEKLGLDRLVSPFLRLIYFKYLNRIEKWAMESSKIVVWENQDCKKKGCYGGMLHELGEGFKGLLENGSCRKRNRDMVVGCESSLDDFHRAMKRSRVSNHHDGERLEVSCVALSDDFAVSTKVQGLDKKKGDLSKMFKWLTLAARSPEDPSIGVIPHHSKWNKYNTGNAHWIQLVRARNALIVQRDYPEFKGNQTLHRSMYPSLYDDDDQKSIARKQPDQTDFEIRPVKEGPKHQAQVDEWTGTSSASDTKWLGTCIWPLKNEEALDETFEDGLVGKGRPDSCSCDSSISNSIECVRFHIAEKRMELKHELGDAFFKWRFDEMGEEVSLRWTQKQEKRFKDMMIADPSDFWKKAARCFKGKKIEQIVSYFFNVFLINKRRYQNRVAPSSIDSDDEGSFGSVGRRFGNDAVTSFDTDIMICSQNRQSDAV